MDAQQKDPQAWPLLLDLDGNISEPWGSNFLFVSKGSIFTFTNRTVLEGVTKGTVVELAEELGKDPIEFRLELLERAKNNPVGESISKF